MEDHEAGSLCGGKIEVVAEKLFENEGFGRRGG